MYRDNPGIKRLLSLHHICTKVNVVVVWLASQYWNHGTHLSEGMPSVLLLCLLCMAYRSSPHGPALKTQINIDASLTPAYVSRFCIFFLTWHATWCKIATEKTLPEENKSSLSSSYSIFKLSFSPDASRMLRRSGWETSGMTSATAPIHQSERLIHIRNIRIGILFC